MSYRMYFATGDTVRLSLSVMGITTHERKVISRIDDKGVWLDNGPGNRESGPYSPATGQWLDNDIIPYSRQWIRPVKGKDE